MINGQQQQSTMMGEPSNVLMTNQDEMMQPATELASNNQTPPQPTPEFLHLLDELYPKPTYNIPFTSTYNPNGSFGAPEGDFDFGPMLDFAALTDEFFPESMDQILAMSSLTEWPNDEESLPTNQGTMVQAPQPHNPNGSFGAPDGDFDFDFARLTDEFFPESVDQILNMSSLNEWPNDESYLASDRLTVPQAPNPQPAPRETIEQAMGRMSLNGRPDEPSTSRNSG